MYWFLRIKWAPRISVVGHENYSTTRIEAIVSNYHITKIIRVGHMLDTMKKLAAWSILRIRCTALRAKQRIPTTF
jgi:hypothetical protein